MIRRSHICLAWLLAMCALVGASGCSDPAPKQESAAPPCREDKDCADGRCDPLRGCVACLFDSDCGEAGRCLEQTCHTEITCLADEDCERGTCETAAGRCYECRKDSECKAGAHCNDGFCIDAVCRTDGDCPAAHSCTDGQCRACEQDADCGANTFCHAGQCLPTCETDDDCPAVYHCGRAYCEPDVCQQDQTSCSARHDAKLACSKSGDTVISIACKTGQLCARAEKEASCIDSVCAPGTWSCTDDLRTAELCAADGAQVIRSTSCTNEEVCANGSCVAKVCEPGASRCSSEKLFVCNDAGSSESSASCDEDELCDDDAGGCVPRTCSNGETTCLEETVGLCNDTGSNFEPTAEDCAASGQACWKGTCRPIVCEPGFSCIDGNSAECASNRTELTVATMCPFQQGKFCNAETGKCQEFACEPGQPTCDGDVSTSCADDGSRPLPDGIDCRDQGNLCWAAECLPAICTLDTYSCDGPDLLQCVHKGTSLEKLKTCEEGTVCDPKIGTCRLQQCEPNAPACNQNLATTCDETGLGYSGPSKDCSATSEVCVSGVCGPVICTPYEVYCEGDQLRKCGPNGGSFVVADTCLDSEYCDAEQQTCLLDVCAANAPVCEGNTLTTCNPDGSGPAPGGTDCAAKKTVCDRAACRPVVCTPDAFSCDAGGVAVCNSAGTAVAPYQNCMAGQHCEQMGPDAACVPN